MNKDTSRNKVVWKRVWNVLFYALLLFFVFSTDAKSWFLRQLVSVGLFQPEIKKEGALKSQSSGQIDFSFIDATGKQISTADLNGKVVFINFWATWCPPCIAEMPSLNDLYNQLKTDERFVFLFINEDDDVAKAKSYLQSKGYDMPLATRAGKVPDEIYSGTLPTTIVLNKEGKVVLKQEGLGAYNSADFIQQLKGLL